MPIDISLSGRSSKMSIHHSIPHFLKFSFCNFSRKFSTGLTVIYPIQEHRSLGFCHKHNAVLTRILASKNPAKPRRRLKTQSDKNWLKAKQSVKQAAEPSIISEQFSSEEDVELGEREAIGVAVSAQANFMRVIVKKAGGVGDFGEEIKPSLKENGTPGDSIDSDKNIQATREINEKTVNGVLKICGEVSDVDENSHGRSLELVTAVNADEVSRTSEEDRGRNSDSHGRVEDSAAMDIRSVSHETESADGDSVHKGAEDLGKNYKGCVDKRGGIELLCVVRALLKKIKRRVLVGDKVLVGSIDWIDKRGMIEDVFERKSEISDPPVANVDHMLVLFSMEQPKLEPFIMTRFLVEAESLEIPFTLVMNKTDLVEEEVLHAWKDRLQSWGYEALYCSADSNLGLTAIANVLEKRTSVVVGPSGVGKSSLINALRHGLDICATSEMDLFVGQVAETRFASHTIVMRRLLKVKDALSQMVIGHQWGVWKISNSERAQRIRDLILNESWWARVAYVLDFTEPIMTMLRFADTDTPCLGDVYDGMDTMVEKVKHSIQAHESDPIQCEALCKQVQAIINHRWNKMTTPLHLLAYALSPRYYSEEIAGMSGRVAPFADEEVAEGCHKALSRLFPLEEIHEKVREEFGLFALGLKHSPFALKDQNRLGAITWWYMYGQPFKHLQPLAIKVLAQVGKGNKWFEELRIGDISTKSGRGKHTTRNVTLLPLPSGGYLTDTPGFNQPSLLKVTKYSLAWMFPEIRQMLSGDSGRCLFNDCLHIGEKGCAVKADWERYPYYLQLLDEIKIREEIQLRLIGTKRESDVRYKVREMGVKQAEPRLEPKKHRRPSRKSLKQSIIEEVAEALEDG